MIYEYLSTLSPPLHFCHFDLSFGTHHSHTWTIAIASNLDSQTLFMSPGTGLKSSLTVLYSWPYILCLNGITLVISPRICNIISCLYDFTHGVSVSRSACSFYFVCNSCSLSLLSQCDTFSSNSFLQFQVLLSALFLLSCYTLCIFLIEYLFLLYLVHFPNWIHRLYSIWL